MATTVVKSSPVSRRPPPEITALEEPLLVLTQRCHGDLRTVLSSFFGFLHRHTDFYMVPHDDDLNAGTAKMGFRPGDAEKILLASFRQFPLRKIPKQQPQQQQQQQQQQSQPQQQQQQKQQSPEKPASNNPSNNKNDHTASTNASNNISSDQPPNNVAQTAVESSKEEHDSTTSNVPENHPPSGIRYTGDGLQIPVGNGGTTKRYQWTQTLEECSVLVRIPTGLRAKDLTVQIKSKFISVRSSQSQSQTQKQTTTGPQQSQQEQPSGEAAAKTTTTTTTADPTVFLEGTLVETIVPDESTWTLEGGVLVLALYKKTKMFWATVLEGDDDDDDDDKIDTSLVDSRRHIRDYDEATQAMIRKIMAEQNQNQQNQQQQQQQQQHLPTAEQLANAKPLVPENLPSGVEFIDRQTLDSSSAPPK